MKTSVISSILGFFFLISSITLGCSDTSTTKESNNNQEKISMERKSYKQLNLDSKYINKRFGFEVSYPNSWPIEEEKDVPSFPDQGVLIYIENNKDNYIRVFGQVSLITIHDPVSTISDFTTDDGIQGTLSSITIDGKEHIYVVIAERYGAHVQVTKEVYEQHKDLIMKILKSIKIN